LPDTTTQRREIDNRKSFLARRAGEARPAWPDREPETRFTLSSAFSTT